MRRPTEEDLQFLRDIRGRFQDLKSHQIGEKVLCFLFLVFFPVLFLLAFFFDPEQSRWGFAAIAFVSSFCSAVFIWRDRGLEYEFAGDEIIERRAGRIRKRIRISDVVDINNKISPRQMILKTDDSKMTVRIFHSLNEVIQKKWAELMAKQSEAERQRYEEAGRQMTSRVKWANMIGAIASVLATVLTALGIRWFTTKP